MPLSPLRVLVVEDEPANREIAQAILEVEGHEVPCVGNGQEALDLCLGKGERFDLILSVNCPAWIRLRSSKSLTKDSSTLAPPRAFFRKRSRPPPPCRR